MTLATEVTGRYSSELIVNASNPQNTTPTTIDHDASQLRLHGRSGGVLETRDDLRPHGREARGDGGARGLRPPSHPDGQGGHEDWDAFVKDLDLLKETDARDRIPLTTDSLLTPTGDDVGDVPALDRSVFQGYEPNPPAGPPTQT